MHFYESVVKNTLTKYKYYCIKKENKPNISDSC